MIFSLFTKHGALNSQPVFSAVSQGLQSLGHTVVYNQETNIDIPVIWSLLWHGRMAANKKIFDTYRQQKKNVLVIEVGGIQRNHTWKVALNGINRAADFGIVQENRCEKLGIKLKPWRTKGDHILICGQHDQSEQWRHMPPIETYFVQQISQLRNHTDRPIVIRPHPRRLTMFNFSAFTKNVRIENPTSVANTYDDFDLNFENAWAVISWSSNPGPQAVIAGIPAFVGPDSLAHDVGNHDLSNIEKPKMPDRTNWVKYYANTEYTVEEIAQGTPFKRLTF